MQALFVELPAFARHRSDYLDDEGFRSLQNALLDNPEAGDVIEGTGGLRKEKNVKRNVFSELTEGFDALKAEREGKVTLRTHAVKRKPAAAVTAKELVSIRQSLKLSRAVFARYLRANERTLENWEQGRAKPNAQAALLIRLVARYPDTVKRLAAV